VAVVGLGLESSSSLSLRMRGRNARQPRKKLRRFQVDPVVVVQNGGGSATLGTSHPEKLAVGVM
jgi:hypothetical protein